MPTSGVAAACEMAKFVLIYNPVEQHGENPRKSVIAVIPARYGSTRLPGKMLLPLGGKPLVIRTAERLAAIQSIDSIIIATDDERIASVAESAGFAVRFTSSTHSTGSDRVAEVARDLPSESIIVNAQGDEPMVDITAVDTAISALLNDPRADMATISESFTTPNDVLDPSNVKVVAGGGYAIFFSRQPIPFPRELAAKCGNDLQLAFQRYPEILTLFRKHVGVYVYRREYLLRFASLSPTALEKTEMLEQLRALEDGARIRLVESSGHSIGVDTEDDLDRVARLLQFGGQTNAGGRK